MFSRLRNAVVGAVSGSELNQGVHLRVQLTPKFPYGRPHFLCLQDEEVQISADHKLRPIIHPSKPLPYNAGYAECVNAGKSKWNEDQAVYKLGALRNIPYTYFGIFDGHAGVGAALCATNQLHHILNEKLVDAQDDIWTEFIDKPPKQFRQRDLLIIGALESTFKEMDELIAEDRCKYQAAGGCTALVALIILGRLYIANAGDSRAIISCGKRYIPMSVDFTPETEKDRIRRIAKEQPDLLGNEFTSREYFTQPTSMDLGKTIKYRDAGMKGWAYKTLQPEDLKLPVITGTGKRSRLMGTIGVTRGFGDHDLLSIYQKTPIKPFLSPHPEVQVHELTNKDEVLIMATDGLWDVTHGSKAASIVSKSLNLFSEKERYVSAATCLVGSARANSSKDEAGPSKVRNQPSVDDISVFVIPLHHYAIEHEKWKKLQCNEANKVTEVANKAPEVANKNPEEANKVPEEAKL